MFYHVKIACYHRVVDPGIREMEEGDGTDVTDREWGGSADSR